MKILASVSRAVAWMESAIIVLLLTTMIGLAFLQVVLRNSLGSSIFWGDPFLRHLVLWVGFLGASLATREEKHINLDIVTRFTSARITNGIRIFTNLFAGIVAGALAKAGWVFLANEDSSELLFSIGQTGFPAWWFQVIIPIGFGLMAFRFLIRMTEHIARAFQPTIDAEPPTNVPTLDR